MQSLCDLNVVACAEPEPGLAPHVGAALPTPRAMGAKAPRLARATLEAVDADGAVVSASGAAAC